MTILVTESEARVCLEELIDAAIAGEAVLIIAACGSVIRLDPVVAKVTGQMD